MKRTIIISIGLAVFSNLFTSCDDFLDKEPLDTVAPEAYLTEESHLSAYAINLYSMFPTHTQWEYGFARDIHTDNQVSKTESSIFVPIQHRVPQDGGEWNFSNIYQCNYFLNSVLPRYEKNELRGNQENIQHYIGEIYFLRAYQYFQKLQTLGDFPIITNVLHDDKEELVAKSKRMPRNEVARFILSDLDKAIELLKSESIDGQKNRLSRQCAYLLKSRVALYEGTWLKYFKGTAFVPNGKDWPGTKMDYNQNYQYPSGNIDNEIDFFLEQAIKAADKVASTIRLVENTGTVQQTENDPTNPYMDMFSVDDLSGYSEILLWRDYDDGLGVTNNVPIEARGNGQTGLTKGYIDCFLMANGLPTYDSESGYSDETIFEVRKNRDSRLFVFMKEPGQKNIFKNAGIADQQYPIELYPPIVGTYTTPTGYLIRKGNNPDGIHHINGHAFIGCPVFRAAEAYLNYIEAYYERYGQLGENCAKYWTAIRNRAHLPSYEFTISKTVVSKEALNDWGAYSAGQLVDATLYNIRRERRCEFIGEGLRNMDLHRWRSMDQMINTPYFVEGMKIWGEMQDWYNDENGKSTLVHGGSSANVSSPTLSNYLRPYQIKENSPAYNGYRWKMAHYLSPIATKHFQLTAPGNDYEQSVIYQNPGWPYAPNMNAEY